MTKISKNSYCSHIPGAPGCLEVEAAGNGVNIKDFAGEEQSWYGLASEGFDVDAFKAHTSAGYDICKLSGGKC